MKKVVGIFISLLMVVFLQPASANTTGSIVIIDNAIDSTLPEFSGKLIYEVCTIVSGTCPSGVGNAPGIQEGPGTATLPKSVIYSSLGSSHGTRMALVALNVNPNAKIIFIRVGRVVGNNVSTDLNSAAISEALRWVANNRTKFNIIAVSASLGNDTYRESSCPVSISVNRPVVDNIVTLSNSGVPVFAAVGNTINNKVAFPACIPQAVSVGAVNRFSNDDGWILSNASLRKAERDFAALGSFDSSIGVIGDGIRGASSPATAALAAYYIKNYRGSSAQTFDYLKSIVKSSPTNFVDVLG